VQNALLRDAFSGKQRKAYFAISQLLQQQHECVVHVTKAWGKALSSGKIITLKAFIMVTLP
jgi:hypothetical protein